MRRTINDYKVRVYDIGWAGLNLYLLTDEERKQKKKELGLNGTVYGIWEAKYKQGNFLLIKKNSKCIIYEDGRQTIFDNITEAVEYVEGHYTA